MNGGCHLTAAASEVSEDTPPFSRLRVECPTSLSRDALQAEFEQYGTVEFVWPVLKHRVFTGVAFVKFDRASSAAFAAESLNSLGTFKVAFAMPRGQRPESFDDGESPPKSRLFLTFHKSATEEVHSLHSLYDRLQANTVAYKITGSKSTAQQTRKGV
eukprot:RCo030488